jgi:GNAT superfamily N-acetyltransferase
VNYTMTVEKFTDTYRELEPLYRQHYKEMADRLSEAGIHYSPYNPRLDEYGRASDGGWLLTFVLRLNKDVCGYANVYITNDMHNQDLIAKEDTVFVLTEHRNGIGKKLVKFVIEELRGRGVKRLNVSAMTDLRVAKLWKRMGFKEAATQMTYEF